MALQMLLDAGERFFYQQLLPKTAFLSSVPSALISDENEDGTLHAECEFRGLIQPSQSGPLQPGERPSVAGPHKWVP